MHIFLFKYMFCRSKPFENHVLLLIHRYPQNGVSLAFKIVCYITHSGDKGRDLLLLI